MQARFLGIARECVYSPGKIEDDRLILEAVADRLRNSFTVQTVSADDALPEPADGTIVFTMGQGPEALAAFERWQARGIRVVNAPQPILNCHRVRMIPLFESDRIQHPESILVDTAASLEPPRWLASGAWIKRGDVHATEAGDVVFVANAAALAEGLSAFAGRGIGRAVVQRHVDGPVIKFYAVLGRFFAPFAPDGCELDAAAVTRMAALADAGARALGLEVYGGDFARDADDRFWLIDMNDWPSYGRCRTQAAEAVAGYLTALAESSREG